MVLTVPEAILFEFNVSNDLRLASDIVVTVEEPADDKVSCSVRQAESRASTVASIDDLFYNLIC